MDFTVDALAERVPATGLSHVELNRYAALRCRDEGAVLARQPEKWGAVRHVFNLALQDPGLVSWFAADLIARLESLQLHLPVTPDSQSPVPGFVRPASALRRLEFEFRHECDVRPLLADQFLPKLRELGLRSEFFTGRVPDHLLRTAELPLFSRVRALKLHELPQDFVLTLFRRKDLQVERLELRNRGYMPNLVSYQQHACRLNAKCIVAIAESGVLRRATHLCVQNERLGEAVLRLVEATTPGTLRHLELVNTDLADAGAMRLAQLPQLGGLVHLSLRENRLTARGVSSLISSPHLNKLQHLDLGSGTTNPYYGGYSEPQPIGDVGIAALANSGIISQLLTLKLAHAEVRPLGVAALARVRQCRFRSLDLSQNTLGVSGMKALARSALGGDLRELDLSLCRLDDEAIRHLVKADLRKVRVLGLRYNSIGPTGAEHLAGASSLANLWKLDLHDNFISDAGLIALARSQQLRKLIELDLEQDVWNFRSDPFRDDAATALAKSTALSRLDSLFAGVVDEYHWGRYRHPFSSGGLGAILKSTSLRPEVGAGLVRTEAEEVRKRRTSEYSEEELERMRRHDFRTRQQ